MASEQTTALIDADGLVYIACSAVEAETQWADDLVTIHSNPKEALEAAKSKLHNISIATGASEIILCFSCPSRHYFRHDIRGDYKANRGSRKPLGYWNVVEALRGQYKTFVRTDLEADDCLGIIATSQKIVPGNKVVVSGDKDLRQIPGTHLCLRNIEDGVFQITDREADDLFYQQALAGDSVDNISGCPGVGMDGAKKLLTDGSLYEFYDHVFKSGPRKGKTEKRKRKCDETSDPWKIIVNQYGLAGLCEEEALAQARLVRILRNTDFNFKKKCVIPWTPNSKEES